MEGVPVSDSKALNFVRDTLPVVGYAAASLGHLIAGAGGMSEIIPKPLTEFLDKYILGFSKLVNVANYTHKGVEAVAGKRAWEGLSRLAYSAVVPFMPLESVFTASGISSGPTMFEQAQRHKIKFPNATEKDPQGTPASALEDLQENGKAFLTMCKETFSNLFGANRKVFIHPDKEQGHTMFLCAWGNFLGAIGGMLAGSNHHSPLGKASSIIRNVGGIGCDWAKFIHPDINNKLSAIFYGVVSICDVAKSFTPKHVSHILSHFSMAMNNFANYYYVNTTKATTDKTFKDYAAVAA
ncbi:MAG: hypothetical protein EBR67_07390 [Proteobacteria bacterium]|nr:hypothetical protein [Pseudomonadota bacterium]